VSIPSQDPNDSTQSDDRILISSGLDGLVMIWGVSVLPQSSSEPSPALHKDDDAPVKELTLAKPPLRPIKAGADEDPVI
jgi:hypothetical protein